MQKFNASPHQRVPMHRPQARRHRPRRRLACDWDGGETMDSKSTEAIKEKLDEAIKILESGLAFASTRREAHPRSHSIFSKRREIEGPGLLGSPPNGLAPAGHYPSGQFSISSCLGPAIYADLNHGEGTAWPCGAALFPADPFRGSAHRRRSRRWRGQRRGLARRDPGRRRRRC
jgi:hypothetical protein